MKKIDLIALDLDGTALNPQNQVSPATADAVRRARESGIHVVVSTGRICGEARDFALMLGTDDQMVTSGGATLSSVSQERCTMRMSMLGTQLDYQIYTTYSKAKNAMYSEVTMSGGGETYSIIMYWDKDACYTLLPVEKMYSVKDEGLDLEEYMEESGMGQITGNAEDLTLDKAEFVTVKGKDCVKETYQLDQSEAAYIFDLATGDLLSISTSMEGTEVSSMEFTTLNGTCDESKLVMPDLTGYTKSDTDLAN